MISNLIIGAGPAGLAVAGRMREQGVEFEMVEASDKIANSWHNHYDRLHLHTVKQFSYLPHLEFPKDYPTYVSRKQLVNYLEHYANHFNINPHFNQKVIAVDKTDKQGWLVSTEAGKEYKTKNVIIATGTNRTPFQPHWPGEELFQGQIIHSRHYKNSDPYRNQNVLVVGMGNTGAEIALDLSENYANAFISVRGPVNIVPRDLNGRPVQVTSKQLAKLPFGLGVWLGSKIRNFYIGNMEKYGLKTSKVPPVVQLQETGKTPVIDIGTVAAIKAGKIKVVQEIDHFETHSVVFKDGTEMAFDSVILATGYRPCLNDFLEKIELMEDKYGLPKSPIADGYHEGLFFVGFDNYKLGGLLGTIFTDSKLIVDHILKQPEVVNA